MELVCSSNTGLPASSNLKKKRTWGPFLIFLKEQHIERQLGKIYNSIFIAQNYILHI